MLSAGSLSHRLCRVSFSPIRVVLARALELEKQGRSIVHLEIGEPDFDTPTPIKEQTVEALWRGLTHYGPNRGVLSLREVVAEDLSRRKGLRVDPERQIIVTVGTAEAIFCTLMALLDPGDEVLICEPAFINYEQCSLMAGAVPVFVGLREELGFQPDPGDIERHVTARTKVIVLNSPHNPTGTVFTREVIAGVLEVARKRGVWVVSDEVYDQLVYDGREALSPASLARDWERVVLVSGFSKAYAMTGWRLGYVVGPEELISAALKVHQYVTTCAPTFLQAGLAAVLLDAKVEQEVERMVREFDRRRRYLVDGLNSIPGISCRLPEGAFYAFANIKRLGVTSEEFSRFALDRYGVAVVPGSAFGPSGEGYVRLSYAADLSVLGEGIARLRAGVAELAPAMPSDA